MAKIKEPKLNSLRTLRSHSINYQIFLYPESLTDAQKVACYIGLPSHQVFKTLVTSGSSGKNPLIALVKSNQELELKKLARLADEKRVRMLSYREAERMTGLRVGGISALSLMHKKWPVYIDSAATTLEFLVMNAGRRGVQVRIATADFIKLTAAFVAPIAKPS